MAQGRQEGHGLPAAMRTTLGGKPLRAWRPSPQGSYIDPDPGLVDEDQTLSFDATVILGPRAAAPRRKIAFASHHAFFEAELLGMHEVPHREVVNLQAASGKLGNKPAYGEIAVPEPLRQPDRVSPSPDVRPRANLFNLENWYLAPSVVKAALKVTGLMAVRVETLIRS